MAAGIRALIHPPVVLVTKKPSNATTPTTKTAKRNQSLESICASGLMGSVLLSALASLTVMLVAVGIVGTVSYNVFRRRREIGIRLALGARRGQVTTLMTRGAVVPVRMGLLVGVAGAFALARLVTSFLYGIAPTDVVTFTTAFLLLTGVAGLAAYVPAHRATGVNPMEVLRTE